MENLTGQKYRHNSTGVELIILNNNTKTANYQLIFAPVGNPTQPGYKGKTSVNALKILYTQIL